MGTDDDAVAFEPLNRAIVSLNAAWEVAKGAAGLSGLFPGGSTAACGEYCGSYDDCTSYCKPMGSLTPGEIVSRPPGLAREMRMPFTGPATQGS